jgi:glycosyltransferase involved in cell wall biosynthesis
MILFLHHRYRTTGGEERVVADLRWLAEEHLGVPTALLERDSAGLGRAAAARGLLAGGVDPGEVADAVARTGATVVHAHNLNPTLGWRALAAARRAGARTVLHLHNYRLVCAVGTCFTRGADCTRCHGRDTAPGIRLNCRGTGPEALVYGASLALWQRRLVEHADAVVVPSEAAAARLREIGAPLPEHVHVVGHVVRSFTAAPAGGARHALIASRLAPEKGVDIAIVACRQAGIPLVVAGDGPERPRLEALARGGDVRFAGRVGPAELAELRTGAGVALVPSRSQETFGLAAAEAMAAGVPVVASRIGALPELLGDEDGLVPPGDPGALAAAARDRFGSADAAARGLARVRAVAAPEAVAPALAAVYGRTSSAVESTTSA